MVEPFASLYASVAQQNVTNWLWTGNGANVQFWSACSPAAWPPSGLTDAATCEIIAPLPHMTFTTASSFGFSTTSAMMGSLSSSTLAPG